MSDRRSQPSWTTLEIVPVYEARLWLALERHRVTTPHIRQIKGRKISDWHVVRLPSFVNVLARLEGGPSCCFVNANTCVSEKRLQLLGG
jgi:hypothetical protein